MLRDLLDAPRGREAVGIVLTGAAVLCALALATFTPTDPSFFASSSSGVTRNWVGPAGAQVSAVLYETFGLAAWFLPLILIAGALRQLRRSAETLRGSAVAGLVLVGLATAILMCLIAGRIRLRGASMMAGGLVGSLMSQGLTALASDVGAAIVAGTMLLVGLALAARSSLADSAGDASRVVRRAVPPGTGTALRRGAGRVTGSLGRGLAGFGHALAQLRHRRRPRPAPGPQAMPAGEPEPLDLGPAARVAVPALAPEALDEPVLLPDDLGLDGEELEPENDPSAQAAAASSRRAPRRAARPRGEQAALPVDLPAARAKLPPLELLATPPPQAPPDRQELLAIARHIERRCAEFQVEGQVTEFHPGPVVTTYEFRPSAGIKLARITSLCDDLALALEADNVRIDRIPGRPTVGIEVPNRRRELIALRPLLEHESFRRPSDPLTIAVGRTQEGEVFVTSLAKMPHMLVAGSTGSGKSVGLNTIITSILYRARPDQVKFIMVDPKMLELGIYQGLPHLLVPVVTDMRLATNALKWGVREMERRYRLLASCNVRDLEGFNRHVEEDPDAVRKAIESIPRRGEGERFEAKPLPYIVVVVDELADLMMTTGHEAEEAIARLAQKARAVGIHLVLATQRPSVDILTGTIKANFPARIGFRVASRIDSRTILDASGAERLLGQGDMLFRLPGSSRLQRVHGAYVSEEEDLRIVRWLQTQAKAEYDKSVLEDQPDSGADSGGGSTEAFNPNDPVYRDAVRLVVQSGQASTSYLQRRMKLGYSRAARIIDQMQEDGVVGPPDGSKPRQILVETDYLERLNDPRNDL
ncbi:MAG: DNA translocase FtsK 4TM domain-containing protein [Acidobacteria bacterium]|jgi:S-DNA-T family DNA segregation ATPase FtsK/SpoIIIE|nr:DNA translocase FtsK 4TM domain-containing protein [Acidobacteriota bacterium]